MSLAARVADEQGLTLGKEVGYSVRLMNCADPVETRIKFVTDGTLMRETMSDPLLSQYSVIILDEVHERSSSTDILMGLLRRIQRRRPDLRVVVASATLEAERTAAFLRRRTTSDAVTILQIPGRQFPVHVQYLEHPASDIVHTTMTTALQLHDSATTGDILCFLPGAEEVDAVVGLVREHCPMEEGKDLDVLPLHAQLPWSQQVRALAPARVSRSGKRVRKCIVATNIAETSVTIDGIRFVIDAGLQRLPVVNPVTRTESLVTLPVSRASALQRAGRAGRQRPGTCFRLYTEEAFATLSDAAPPAITREDLTGPCLHLLSLGVRDIAKFPFLDPPPVESLLTAVETLHVLGAVDTKGFLIDPIGPLLAECPVEPRMATVLLLSLFPGYYCAEEALTLAAMTGVQNVFKGRYSPSREDEKEGRPASKRRKVMGSSWDRVLRQPAKRNDGESSSDDDDAAASKTLQMARFAVMEGDHPTLVNIFHAFEAHGSSPKWCAEYQLNFAALRRASEIRRQLEKYLATASRQLQRYVAERPSGSKEPDGPLLLRLLRRTVTNADEIGIRASGEGGVSALLRCVLGGFCTQVAYLGSSGKYYTLRENEPLELHPSSVLAQFPIAPAWVCFHEAVAVDTSHARIREVSAIRPHWLEEVAPQVYRPRDRATKPRAGDDDTAVNTGSSPRHTAAPRVGPVSVDALTGQQRVAVVKGTTGRVAAESSRPVFVPKTKRLTRGENNARTNTRRWR